MSAITALLRVAHAYAEAANVETKTVSWRVFGDSKKLAAIEAGSDIQVKRCEAAMRWFDENWPTDAAWPEGIPSAATPSEDSRGD